MCIPPADEPAGPHFALLAKIAARNGLAKLSMGMSGDFETAIAFGATSVRVGSAVFGAREPRPAPRRVERRGPARPSRRRASTQTAAPSTRGQQPAPAARAGAPSARRPPRAAARSRRPRVQECPAAAMDASVMVSW